LIIGFKNEKRAQKDLKDAFEVFLNRDIKAVSNLASYVDEVLKVGAKIATEVDIEKKLDQVIVIFKFLTNKVFTCSLFTHSLTHPPTHSLTHSLAHSTLPGSIRMLSQAILEQTSTEQQEYKRRDGEAYDSEAEE
jgi:hypothetical protein